MALRTDVVRLESMMTTRRTRSFAALAAASALALSACGGDSDTEGSSSSTSSSAESSASSSEGSESPSESASESPSESESAEGESGGEGSVTASKSGVTFDVPDGWTTVDPSALAKDPDKAPQSIKTMAETAGQPVDQFLTQLSQSIDVLVMGEAEDGFSPNINVIPSPQALTESDLKASLAQQSATVSGTEEVDTDSGKATVATYTMSAGSQTVHGQMIAVPSDSGAAVITVSTIDKDETAEVAKTITDSVTKAS
ncbi:dipeptide ABC transporter periplasmic protein [Janibacter hoylei PVAS-1]|uniref:Dipeptide ABC transporter periplasmic protein n=2 Tax=Janibacter TaxID=53457 RepID=K1DYQ3_9MICO|nr:hypothetical protein [Janibacter hoylei]EKA61539.1 dipeptide ABC transporter periplasmic protein [Janibacter hoylei PVAS-1]MCW4601806.1 hypothetical protein [Janibacter hoylei]